MQDSVHERRPGELLPQDQALLRSLHPSRMVKQFGLGVVLYSAVFFGIDLWSSGSWIEAASPLNLAGGLVVAGVNSAFEFWQNRRLLRRTSKETQAQLQRDWRFFTDEGWLLRIVGLSAGISAFFVIFSILLTALTGALPGGGGFWLEALKNVGLFTAGLVLVLLLVRTAFRRVLPKGLVPSTESDSAHSSPESSTGSGAPGCERPGFS